MSYGIEFMISYEGEKMSKVIKPTKEDQVTLDRKVYKSFVREIAEEMFRRSTMQWNYHDLHDII